jgi:hypothetical protein
MTKSMAEPDVAAIESTGEPEAAAAESTTEPKVAVAPALVASSHIGPSSGGRGQRLLAGGAIVTVRDH